MQGPGRSEAQSRPFKGLKRPYKGLIRPLKGLIRPFKGLKRPYKNLIRPLKGLKGPYKALIRGLRGIQAGHSQAPWFEAVPGLLGLIRALMAIDGPVRSTDEHTW